MRKSSNVDKTRSEVNTCWTDNEAKYKPNFDQFSELVVADEYTEITFSPFLGLKVHEAKDDSEFRMNMPWVVPKHTPFNSFTNVED